MYLNKTLIKLPPVDCVATSEPWCLDLLPGVSLLNVVFSIFVDKVRASLPITESQT